MPRPRVILADDFEGLHAAITRLLSPTCDVVGYAGDGLSVLDAAARLRPDMVVVDLHLTGLNGLRVCCALNDYVPPIRVIMLTAADETTYGRGHSLPAQSLTSSRCE